MVVVERNRVSVEHARGSGRRGGHDRGGYDRGHSGHDRGGSRRNNWMDK